MATRWGAPSSLPEPSIRIRRLSASSRSTAGCSRGRSGPVAVNDKAFDALVYLIEHAGQLITKDDLHPRPCGPTSVVEENNLYVVISALRRALKDESGSQRA